MSLPSLKNYTAPAGQWAITPMGIILTSPSGERRDCSRVLSDVYRMNDESGTDYYVVSRSDGARRSDPWRFVQGNTPGHYCWFYRGWLIPGIHERTGEFRERSLGWDVGRSAGPILDARSGVPQIVDLETPEGGLCDVQVIYGMENRDGSLSLIWNDCVRLVHDWDNS